MAFQHHSQPCDTYFVESEDYSWAQQQRQYQEKLAGRRKQQQMADELSRQATDLYQEDIVEHMKRMEVNIPISRLVDLITKLEQEETLADVASIDIQQEIQWFMRPYLIDFLIEAHAAFQLLPETLFLAVNLLDRYCSRRVVYKRHYQLVGCAALLIAAKYGDRKERVPMIKELKSMCCSLYDEEMFTQMEWHVLNTLEWNIGHPTVDTWMQLALNDSSDDVEVEHMALFLSEIALYHKEFVQCKSSVMSSASLALARGILGRPDGIESNSHDSATILRLSQMLEKPSQVLARKYAAPHMSRVSIALENFLRHQESLRRVSPPTPPCEQISMKPIAAPEMFPGTPQKVHPYGTMVNGYMTPPITPEGEYFANGNEIKGYQARCPVTPTPNQNHYAPQQQFASYQHDMTMH